MADGVQVQIESMIEELKDAKKKNLFTEAEIKSIVKQRTNHEYAIRRRGALKADFIKYIDYEWSLEKIRKKRVARMGLKYKTTLCDYAGIKRLHNLYNRAVGKFPGDVSMWLRYIDMAKKMKSHRRIGSIFARALQLLPRNVSLWVLAAAWEFEHHANAAAARKLMQRAVHLNREERDLWTEWFKMEAMFVTKIRLRAELAEKYREAEETEDNKSDVTAHEAEDMDMLVGGELDSGSDEEFAVQSAQVVAAPLNASLAEKAAKSLNSDDAIIQYQIPKIIYDEAIAARPHDLELRRTCLAIAAESLDADDLVSHIVSTIREHLSQENAAAVILSLAWRVIPGVGGVAVTNPTYPALLHEALASLDEHVRSVSVASPQKAELRDAILDLLKEIHGVAAPADPGLRLYVRAQIRRHIVSYLRVASPKFTLNGGTGKGNYGELPPSAKKVPLLESTYEKCIALASLATQEEEQPKIARLSIARIATKQFPLSLSLANARIALEPQYSREAVEAFVSARVTTTDLIDLLLGIHSKVAKGMNVSNEPHYVATKRAEDAMTQWKIVNQSPLAAAAVDELTSKKAVLLRSVLTILPPSERIPFRESFVAITPVVSCTWLEAIVDAVYPGDNLGPVRQLLQTGASRWPKNVSWWLRWLRFESSVAKDVRGAMQVFMRASREVQPEQIESLTEAWNEIKA